MEKKYVLSAFIYALIGMAMGIYMAATKNHSQMVTHTHIMLLGFVTSFIYAVCLKLWINNTSSRLSVIQFCLHQIGTVCMSLGLFLLYGQQVPIEQLEIVLSLSSMAVLLAVVLILVQFLLDWRTSHRHN